MGINVEPTLLCDRCQQPIEKGRKVIELSASTFDGIENPAFAPAYINTKDEDYYFFMHPACIMEAIDDEVEAAVEEATQPSSLRDFVRDIDFDSDTITISLMPEESDAAEPVECDSLEQFHQCCGTLDCRYCHEPVESLRGVPGTVFGVDREEWDSYGRSPYARACGK